MRFNIFHSSKKAEPLPLRIDGISPAPITPEPKDDELAAAVLLEAGLTFGRACSHSEELMRASLFSRLLAAFKVKGSGLRVKGLPETSKPETSKPETPKSASYYRILGEKIRKARTTEAYTAQRYIAYSEQELQNASDVDGGALALIENGLYRHMDTVERESGELKTRWQHCLAEVTVRMMGVIKRS